LFLSGALFVLDKRMIRKSADIEKKVVVTDVEKVAEGKLGDLLFEFDSADISAKGADRLKKLGEYMKNNPKTGIALFGFTDAKGPSEYNLDLSRRRVESVGSYLERNFKIAPERIALAYYGEANPIASNDTPEGRSQNRRIEGFIFDM
jgi:OOP family OmpA-OmpF porin